MTKTEAIKLVQENGCLLEQLPLELKANKEVVLAAVSNKGKSLEFASDELFFDKDIISVACSNMTRNELVSLISEEKIFLVNLPFELQNDREVVMAAVSVSGISLWCASDVLKNDKEIVLTAVSNVGSSIQHAY